MSYTKYCPKCTRGVADLHVHTSASDGLYTPQEIIKLAQRKGLQYLAITDHDTTAGLESIISRRSPLMPKIVPGIELSTDYEGQEIHILGYFIDINNKELQNTLNKLAESRKQRIHNIINKLQLAGYGITIDDVKKYAVDTASPGRPHVALALIEKGIVSNIKDAFSQLLNKGCPGYVPRLRISSEEAISLIYGAHGIPVFAHPGSSSFSLELLQHLIRAGLQGIEAFYPQHNREMQNYFYDIARNNELLITGGSDYHGHERAERMFFGNIPVPADTITVLKQALEKIKHSI